MARVLLVEPDRSVRTFVAGILSDLGHHVAQAKSVGDFRELLGRAPFDVIATDLVLDKNGGQVSEAAGALKIVTLSGAPFTPDQEVDPVTLRDRPFRLDNLLLLASTLAACAGPELLAA